MSYVIINATNENGDWQADVSQSDDGFAPSGPSYHLMLGSHPLSQDARRLTVGEILTMVGWAIKDQAADDETSIRAQANGARQIIKGAPENAEFVVNVNAGGITKDQAVARLTDGANNHRQLQAA